MTSGLLPTERGDLLEVERDFWVVLRGLVMGVKPSVETGDADFFWRLGESPSIDLLFAIVYNYNI